MTRGYFVTGTDTGVGKTIVSALLMLVLGADYWKPVQSGLDGETDTQAVQRLTGLSPKRFHPSTYALNAPLSPHESARRDGVGIRLDAFCLPRSDRPLVVEGAGGALVPLSGDALMIDLMKRLGLPILLVARTSLGTINHTLLSLEALRARRLGVAGVVMNGPRDEVSRNAIEIFGGVRVIAELPHFEPLDAESLASFARTNPLRFSEVA